MLCQACGNREATFHFKEIINGELKSLHLCEVCAKEKGLSESFLFPSFSLSDFIAGLSEMKISTPEKTGVSCPQCRLTFTDIQKKGVIGCSSCYQIFEEHLTPLLKRIQGRTSHSGKVPRREKAKNIENKQVYELRRSLEEAVRKEEYEKAAQLRDKIRKLEKEKG